MYEAEELRALLAVAGPNMKAMILLACQCGARQCRRGRVTFGAANLKTGWATYPRPKTGIERRIPLWAETVEALKAAIAQRREPKDAADKALIFVGPRGESYLAQNGYRVAGRVCPRAGHRRGLSRSAASTRSGTHFRPSAKGQTILWPSRQSWGTRASEATCPLDTESG